MIEFTIRACAHECKNSNIDNNKKKDQYENTGIEKIFDYYALLLTYSQNWVISNTLLGSLQYTGYFPFRGKSYYLIIHW